MRGRRIPLPALLSACAALCLLPNSHAQGASGPVSAEKSIIYGPAINRRERDPSRDSLQDGESPVSDVSLMCRCRYAGSVFVCASCR